MSFARLPVFAVWSAFSLGLFAAAPHARGVNPLVDPTASILKPRLESSLHQPLAVDYIQAVGRGTEQRFRKSFHLSVAPGQATLYVAGAKRIEVFLNGHAVQLLGANPSLQSHENVLHASVAHLLRQGDNVIAIAVVTRQQPFYDKSGAHLAAEILAAPLAVLAPPLVHTDGTWKSQRGAALPASPLGPAPQPWQEPRFNDAGWTAAHDQGGIESDIGFFQAKEDEGMYAWPGYDGISPFLARLELPPSRVLRVNPAGGRFAGLSQLANASGPLTFTPAVRSNEPPSLVLDFGRESTGRVALTSASTLPMTVVVRYGESLGEALEQPYYGADTIHVPPHATVYGPKSAFRYAKITLLTRTPRRLRFARIGLDFVYYPVRYQGSFISSDAVLNRIWAVSAYTAHLCMQDDIWDAPKRDRARWIGDLNVSGRVIDDVFGDRFLMKDTMNRLLSDAGNPIHSEINWIPGYSAFWIMTEADYYRRSGDRDNLLAIQPGLDRLVAYMEEDLDANHLFANRHHLWPFVDWSPDLSSDTPEARRATDLEYCLAFKDAAWLMQQAGRDPQAAAMRAEDQLLIAAARQHLWDSSLHSYGLRHQTNAMAILSGVATQRQIPMIYANVLSRPRRHMITPYYNSYVLRAMDHAGHPQAALHEIRSYWGSMMATGASSTYEAWDPAWPKQDFHRYLQADDSQGYFVSLAHGWSSAPAFWLPEHVLGIQPLTPGFKNVRIAPELLGLSWARGGVATPQGPVTVVLRKVAAGESARVRIPSGIQARFELPEASAHGLKLDGHSVGATAQAGLAEIPLGPGVHLLQWQ